MLALKPKAVAISRLILRRIRATAEASHFAAARFGHNPGKLRS
jgi:hypothetical protein